MFGGNGCLLFIKKLRKYWFVCKWNTIFWFVPLENFWEKRNFRKDNPAFQLELSIENCVPLIDLSPFLPVPNLSRLDASRCFSRGG